MNCGEGEATEGLENKLWRRWSDGKVGEWAELYLRHSSFSNPSVASPSPQFILEPFFRFSYVTSSSLNSPGEPPMHYKQNTTTSHVELSHFCCLMYIVFLLDPLTKRARCDDDFNKYMVPTYHVQVRTIANTVPGTPTSATAITLAIRSSCFHRGLVNETLHVAPYEII